MRAARVRVTGGLLAVLIAGGSTAAGPGPARAVSCQSRGVEVDLAGSGDVGVVSGRSAATCQAPPRPARSSASAAPSYTDEVMCSVNGVPAQAGLCSATPCRGAGLHFVLRTPRQPGGRAAMARAACMRLVQARAGPGISAAQVLTAVRAVELPGGSIHATPSGRGLANLASYFRRDGVTTRTVDLPLRASTIHAEFQVTQYRWKLGDGSASSSIATGLPDSLGVGHAYTRRGRYEIRVEVAWSADAFLDGRHVGRIDDLVSSALISYPVAEVRTVLSG
jgi:hypothetical protein